MQPERRRAIARPGRLACVVRDRARRREHHQTQVLPRAEVCRVVSDKALRNVSDLIVRNGLRYECARAAKPKTGEMIGQAEEPVVERAAQVAYGSTEDEPSIVDGDMRRFLSEELSVEVSQR